MSENENSDSGAKTGKKRRKGGIIFLIAVIILAIAALVFAVFFKKPLLSFKNSVSPKFNTSNLIEKVSKKNNLYVAKVHISGIIQNANENYNQEWLLSTISELKDDPRNAGILLVIDSPGGAVYESDEAYLALMEYKESGKNVWAYFESLAASGGYYIGCAADTIYANRNTLTGSIGVIAGSSIDATEFLAKMGIKSTTFTAGKNKNMLNYNSPLTEEQREIMQSVADECYDQFVRIVADARNKTVPQVRELADGRIYTALQARTNGLIDSIGPLSDAEEKMSNQVALANGMTSEEAGRIDFENYFYEYTPPLFSRFMGMFSKQKNSAALDPLTQEALRTIGPDIKYPAYLYRQ